MARKPVPNPRRRSLGIKKGDRVEVIAGNSRGAQGVVRVVHPKFNRVTIEGVNLTKRHMRQSQRYPNGGIIEIEAPVHVSNVRLVERRDFR